MEREILNQYSKEILSTAITVHKEMGPGLVEAIYQQCLSKGTFITGYQSSLNGSRYPLNKDYVFDLLVEEEIILELKAVESILPVHAQIISYLKLADKRLGFLINFNVTLLKNGFSRFVNNFLI